MLETIWAAILNAAHMDVLIVVIFGIILGIFLGAIPGLGAMIGIGVCLPLTFEMQVVAAVAFIAAIYKGALFGGSISAILINTPGTAAAAATCFDGYPMSRQGQSKKAVQAALLASASGDMFSDILLIIGSLALARVAMKFGPPEMFWVLVFALIMTASLAGKMVSKGILSMCLGLLLGCIGLDPISSVPRFDFCFGMGKLEGLDMVTFLLGAFAISEVFLRIEKAKARPNVQKTKKKEDGNLKIYGPSLSFADIRYCLKGFLVSSSIGSLIGMIPGMGATAGAFIGYGTVSQVYGDKPGKPKFGEGNIAGVVAAESGNNAVSGSNLLPLLTLGVPGSAEAALILAALMLHGINVGPTIFNSYGESIYTIFVAFIVSNIFLIILGNIFIKPLTKMLKSDPTIVFPIVMMVCFTGCYSLNRRVFDVVVAIVVGLMGYLMKKVRIPIAPMVISFVLSKQMEQLFRQSLAMSRGSMGVFVKSPLSMGIMIVCIFAFALVVYRRIKSHSQMDTY